MFDAHKHLLRDVGIAAQSKTITAQAKQIADLQDQFVAHSATANAYQKVIE